MTFVDEILDAIYSYEDVYVVSLIESKLDNSIHEFLFRGSGNPPKLLLFNNPFLFLNDSSKVDWSIVFTDRLTESVRVRFASKDYRKHKEKYSVAKAVPEDCKPIDYEKISELI